MEDLMNEITLYLQSNQTFPVDFDAFWQWCGYSTKQKAEQMLQKNFTQEVDFNFNREVKVQKEGKRQVTRKIKSYQLTIDCAKSFAMLAQTEKGREVRLYFLECEKRLKALTKGKNKLQILKESVETLIDHEERISDLEQERADAKAYLAAINKDPSQALFVDTRRAFDHIIKSYALAKGVPPQEVYATFYRQFSVRYQVQLYHLAQKADKTPIAWLESRGYITQAYDLARELFVE
jgi:phage anti-repressor protein